MVKLNVDEEKCIGCGACVAIDPEHFDFNDNGLSNVISNENLESANLKSAQESCPTGAITVGEEVAEATNAPAEKVVEEKCGCCENCTGNENCDCGCENCECDK